MGLFVADCKTFLPNRRWKIFLGGEGGPSRFLIKSPENGAQSVGEFIYFNKFISLYYGKNYTSETPNYSTFFFSDL